MRIDLEVVTPPSLEPLTVEELRDHLRIETADEDVRLAAIIQAARQWVESHTGRQLMPATWRLYLDVLCAPIVLPKPPLRSVSSITYVDLDGATQTLAASEYQVIQPTGPWAGPATIVPAYQVTWPIPRDQRRAVSVTFSAGYDVGSCPLVEAVRWYAEYLYEPVSDVLRQAAIAALQPYRVAYAGPFRE